MKRRTYLGVTSTVLIAGCLSSSDEPTSGTTATETPATSTSTPQEQTPSPETETETPHTTSESGSPNHYSEKRYKTVTIGDRGDADDYYDPHTVNIWNVEESTRDFTVTIESQSTKNSQTPTVLDETYTVPGDTSLVIELPEPATYTIEIHVPSDNGEKTINIQQQDYDCNKKRHYTTVYPDGRIEVRFEAETAGCGTPPDDS